LGSPAAPFTLVIGAFAKLLPPQWRTIGFGAGTAAGSFGQFLFSPLAVALIDNVGWQNTLLTFAAILLVLLPAGVRARSAARSRRARLRRQVPGQSVLQALAEALGPPQLCAAHPRLLSPAAFSCSSSPCICRPIFIDRGLPASIGGWTIAVIGLFNIFGSIARAMSPT
jgi:MFS family permease